ncbi:endonuclease V [Comamonas sp. 23]|uniref:endonuclease V n=1 Tax=Comamonas sp. 23 TaxID=3415008 RepID=UPI003C6EB3DE
MIAILDVHYQGQKAQAACVTASDWSSPAALHHYLAHIEAIQDYEPGAFYKRELPCLLSVLQTLPALPQAIVIDGYVWLGDEKRAGLGAHLYEALDGAAPVIGVAKTAFHGVASCPDVVQVRRGQSQRPLFVTAVGDSPQLASARVSRMAGAHRIPSLLALTDQLSRSGSMDGQLQANHRPA